MNQLFATLRHRPGPLVGTFVALTLAALLITVNAFLIGTSLTLVVPAQRLAATTVVVTGNLYVRVTSGTGINASTDKLALTSYRRLDAGVAARLASLPGVAAAVPDVSVPVALGFSNGHVATGSSTDRITAHGWQSARLTPFHLTEGRAPIRSDELVVGMGLARSLGLRVGDRVQILGRELPPFIVTGVAAAPEGNPVGSWTIFVSNAQASALYGHPGEADLIGVIARPGASADAVATRVRSVTDRHGLTVLTGTQRGQAEDLNAAGEKTDLFQLALGAGLDVVLIALFVVAGTVALSVTQRWRNIALLRAVGATPGQVRRMMFLELTVLGALAGLAGYLPAVRLTSWAINGLAAHQLLPASASAWTSPWVLFVAAGAGIVVAQLAGFIAGRRASRISPVAALGESHVENRRLHWVRIVLGVAAIGSGVALCVVSVVVPLSVVEIVNFALFMGLSFMAGIALLGPLFVSVAELVLRLPVRLLSRVSGRLALAEIKCRPRRISSAVVAIALGVAFVGAIYYIDLDQAQAAVTQSHQRLVADLAVSAPGPGLAPAALPAVESEPGVAEAIAIAPTTVYVPYPGNDLTAANAVTPGSLNAVLDLDVVSGSLDHFGPGDIALSKLVAGKDAVGTHVGATITTYLADGTPYRARVVAIYSRSLGFGDALVPASSAGGGHLGTTLLGEILVTGRSGVGATALSTEIDPLSGRFPGLQVASRSILNAQAREILDQTAYANDLLLGLITLLCAITLVNTLVMATVEHREPLFLLRRVGTTTRQLLWMTAWQTSVLVVLGMILGAAAAGTAVVFVSKALTNSWNPYLTATPIVVMAVVVLGLAACSTFGPTVGMLARDQEL